MKTLEKGVSLSLSVAALGIVYGDIGTSPLYAMREAIGGLPTNSTSVLGILSLIFWSLIAIISIKYLWLVFRADNNGEGGILSLLALLKGADGKKMAKSLFIIAIFGAGLMFGDGMLTPAISIVSAVEGLNVIVPQLSHYIIPLSCIILLGLFSVQHYGTGKIGFIFGPIILLWFITIGIIGFAKIIENPFVLKAINPFYAFDFIHTYGWKGYRLLGDIFLVVTGGEALYADLGHLGKKPIRVSWFLIALPALLLNYFGQGAYLLSEPTGISNPFYLMAPSWFLIPLLLIATLATVIASQAVITATFSITRQAVLLGLYPHLPIQQTSKEHPGQIYIPQINFFLGLGTLALILYFKSSSALAHAYGININLDMALTTIMIAVLAYTQWNWSLIKTIAVFSIFLSIDFMFLGANMQKFTTGGWLPVALAGLCAIVMYTWTVGMEYLRTNHFMKKEDITKILRLLHRLHLQTLSNSTAIFIADFYDKSGGGFLQFLKISRAMPEHVLIVNYQVKNIPYVNTVERFEVKKLDENIIELTLHYGFMDFISIPQALFVANELELLPFKLDVDKAIFLVEIPNIIASSEVSTLTFFWQEKLFSFFLRNYSANLNAEFYQLPLDRTITLGTYFKI